MKSQVRCFLFPWGSNWDLTMLLPLFIVSPCKDHMLVDFGCEFVILKSLSMHYCSCMASEKLEIIEEVERDRNRTAGRKFDVSESCMRD
jgi:hypothetical protein